MTFRAHLNKAALTIVIIWVAWLIVIGKLL